MIVKWRLFCLSVFYISYHFSVKKRLFIYFLMFKAMFIYFSAAGLSLVAASRAPVQLHCAASFCEWLLVVGTGSGHRTSAVCSL